MKFVIKFRSGISPKINAYQHAVAVQDDRGEDCDHLQPKTGKRHFAARF